MKLNVLAQAVPGAVEIIGEGDVEITSLTIDSRAAKEGALFFCTPGLRMDAHDFAPQAVEKGAAALVVSRRLDIDCPQLLVENVRTATAYIAACFYGNPAEELHLVGITGTKGKSTSSFLVKSIFEHAGYKAGLIGTVCAMIDDEVIPTKLTTPDPLEVQALFRRMVDAGVTHVVMEVSAHALAMQRLAGMRFDVAVFTNFSQDHLDFFASMDEYFEAKMQLMDPSMSDNIVYSVDDERVCAGVTSLGRQALRTGIRECCDMYAKDIEVGERGCSFLITYHKRFRIPIQLKLSGVFNVYNSLSAAAACVCLGINPEAIRAGLEDVRVVPGRIELLETDTPYRVILDYAHTPDSLESILKTVRGTMKRGRMIAVFGCGGGRDQGKRPIMGEIAGELADYCVLTSDNPRNEDPMAILAAIEEGISGTGCEYVVIENRREAIRYAMSIAGSGDAIVLAGKGHETYQEIDGVRRPFNEKTVVVELLAELTK